MLYCSHHGDQVFDSYVAATSLINYLATAMARRAHRRARARMAWVKRAHELLDDLDPQA